MSELIYLISSSTQLLLSVVQVAILIHVIMSWFDPEESGFLTRFTYYICEPFVIPARMLLGPIQEYYGSPLDFSYTLTALVLLIIEALLF